MIRKRQYLSVSSNFTQRKRSRSGQPSLRRRLSGRLSHYLFKLFKFKCRRERIPILSSIVNRKHHHDVRDPIRLCLDNDRNLVEAEPDGATPSPLSIKKNECSAVPIYRRPRPTARPSGCARTRRGAARLPQGPPATKGLRLWRAVSMRKQRPSVFAWCQFSLSLISRRLCDLACACELPRPSGERVGVRGLRPRGICAEQHQTVDVATTEF
jgi:hypothetical protein